MQLTQVRVHRLLDSESNTALNHALSILQQDRYLANAITLYSRLCYGHFSLHSYLLTINFEQEEQQAHQSWLLAFVDRSRRPETELYMSASWEADDIVHGERQQAEGHQFLTALFRSIEQLGLPESIHTLPGSPNKQSIDLAAVQANGRHESSHEDDQLPFVCGAIHERTYQMVKETTWLTGASAGKETPYRPFLFNIEHLLAAKKLAAGLKWDMLQPRHLALVRSTSTIPRHESTLSALPSVAILDLKTGEPAAWGFIGIDGSLSTLYVMPEYRHLGLGVALCLQLLKEKMGEYCSQDGRKLGHSYVALDNEASIKTAQRAGGVAAGHLKYWLRIDLAKACC